MRREAVSAAKSGFELPARGLSVAALVAVTGGTVASVGAAKVIGGGDGSSGTGPGKRAATVAKAPERARSASGGGVAASGARATPASASNSAASSTAGASGDAQAKIAASSATPAGDAPGALSQGHAVAAAAASTGGPVDGSSDGTDAGAGNTDGSADGAGAAGGPADGSGTDAPSGQGPGAGTDAADGKADGPAAGGPKTGDGSRGSAGDGDGAKDQPAGGVDDLQQAIGVAPDGDFGPRTERALKHWQRQHGLEADGIAGPQTREALGIGDGKVLKPARPKHAGGHHAGDGAQRTTADSGARQHSGGGVRALQQALGVGADGVFGPGTEQALKQWQRAHGLTPDGVAGPQTRQALGIGDGKVLKRRGGGHRGSSGGGSSSVVQRVVAAANAIATAPYLYGGGHGSFQASGYDCSGSVSYALHGGGLLSRPLDSSALEGYGLAGPGRHITIYANAGHAYMVIDGRRYDTSARSESGSRWSSTQRSSSGYVVRHPRGL